MQEPQRSLALHGKMAAYDQLLLKVLKPRTRISVRADHNAKETLEAHLNLAFPGQPKTSTKQGDMDILWLGPDEWLILDKAKSNIGHDIESIKNFDGSAVDISHRNVAIRISGEKAALALNSGCPQDLSIDAFPVGACSRTLLGKSEIILLRTAENQFHLECWRSFSEYVWCFLLDSAKSA